MSALRETRFISLEHYLAIDRDSSERYEFRNGELFCMGGAQPEHNTICLNLGSELRTQLRGSLCRAFPSDQRVKVNAGSPYLYPDRYRPPFLAAMRLRARGRHRCLRNRLQRAARVDSACAD